MIIRYAWAHPVTGMREQTQKIDCTQAGDSRLLAQARAMLWEELQATGSELLSTGIQSATVHQQVKIGTVRPGHWEVEGAVLQELEASGIDPEFAWCDPWNGQRMVAENFPTHLADKLKDDPREFCQELWIYAILASYPVRRDEPRPEVPELPESPAIASLGSNENPSIIQAKKAELENLYVAHDPHAAAEIARLTAWALLDIAESLRQTWPATTPISFTVGPQVPTPDAPLSSPFTPESAVFRHVFEPSTKFIWCAFCGRPKDHPLHQ